MAVALTRHRKGCQVMAGAPCAAVSSPTHRAEESVGAPSPLHTVPLPGMLQTQWVAPSLHQAGSGAMRMSVGRWWPGACEKV